MPDAKNDPAIWTPASDAVWRGGTLAAVINSYKLLLEVCYPEHLKPFKQRLADNPEGATAEAVVFSWLRTVGLDPEVNETCGGGGADFLCLHGRPGKEFLIEVTSLKSETATNSSGWSNELSETAQAFRMIIPQLTAIAKKKARQLGKLGHPHIGRVLAICLDHLGASALLGTTAAKWMMVSQPKMSASSPGLLTDLKDSAFFGPKNGVVVPMRKSISAILLLAVSENQLNIVGMLHPEPAVPINYRMFEKVPFLRVEWPFSGGVINTEWVMGNPSSFIYDHNPITLSNKDLRKE